MRIDLTGHRYGKLVVVALTDDARAWVCKCDCGGSINVTTRRLRHPRSRTSCGCIQRREDHGLSGHPLYATWCGMKQRCADPGHQQWKYYGARGIRVCDAWEQSFTAFLADMGEKPSPKHTLDRRDGNKGYGPDNCRWVTPLENAHNSSRPVFLEFNGRRMSLRQWSFATGISDRIIGKRVRSGWTLEQALTIQPVVGRNQSSGHR